MKVTRVKKVCSARALEKRKRGSYRTADRNPQNRTENCAFKRSTLTCAGLDKWFITWADWLNVNPGSAPYNGRVRSWLISELCTLTLLNIFDFSFFLLSSIFKRKSTF